MPSPRPDASPGLYEETDRARSKVDLARSRFGKGEHRYFDRPFPEAVEAFAQALQPPLLPIAERCGSFRRATA